MSVVASLADTVVRLISSVGKVTDFPHHIGIHIEQKTTTSFIIRIRGTLLRLWVGLGRSRQKFRRMVWLEARDDLSV